MTTQPAKLTNFTIRHVNGRLCFAFDIKHHGAGVDYFAHVDFDELRTDLGLTNEVAPAHAKADPMPFGREWCEAWTEAHKGDWGVEQRVESNFEQCQGDAKELLGAHVTLETDVRSGGWLIVRGIDPEEIRDALEAPEDAADKSEDDDTEARREVAQMTLDNLAKFATIVQGYVDDFPRAVAWQIGANVFEHAVAEYEKEQSRNAALAASDLARDVMRAFGSDMMGGQFLGEPGYVVDYAMRVERAAFTGTQEDWDASIERGRTALTDLLGGVK